MGEARRRRVMGKGKQIPFPGTLAYATTPGYGLPLTPGKQPPEQRRRQLRQDWPQVEPPGKKLTEQQRIAALVMYLFAILTWDPGPDDDDDDERWTTYCMNKYAYHPNQNSLEACVWWAMRHENSPSLRDDDWLGYLAHVCRNHGILAR